MPNLGSVSNFGPIYILVSISNWDPMSNLGPLSILGPMPKGYMAILGSMSNCGPISTLKTLKNWGGQVLLIENWLKLSVKVLKIINLKCRRIGDLNKRIENDVCILVTGANDCQRNNEGDLLTNCNMPIPRCRKQ